MAGPEIKQNPEEISPNEVQKQDLDFVNKLEDKTGDQIISTYITEKGGDKNAANVLKPEAQITIFKSIETYKIENQASCSTETLQTIAITQDMLKGLQKGPIKPLTPEELAKKAEAEKAKNDLDMNGYLNLVSDKADVKNASKNIIE